MQLEPIRESFLDQTVLVTIINAGTYAVKLRNKADLDVSRRRWIASEHNPKDWGTGFPTKIVLERHRRSQHVRTAHGRDQSI